MSAKTKTTPRKSSAPAEAHARGPYRWTLAVTRKEAQRYSCRVDFKRGSDGAYHAAHRNGWLDSVCAHMTRKPSVRWTLPCCRKEALRYSRRSDFARGSGSAYGAAKRNGWLDTVCAHMTRGPSVRWTLTATREEAQRYSRRSDFARGSVGAYRAARRNGWLDSVCAHMPHYASVPVQDRKPIRYWNLDRVRAEALRYTTRNAFCCGAPSAYGAARANGWFDSVCAHMKPLKKAA